MWFYVLKCRTSVIANIYLLRDIVMLFKGRGGSWMFLMGMNCFTFTYVILLVPCLTLNRCNDRWNTFKGIYFLVCYSKSSFYTFLLYGFCDSCEVHAEIFHTWDMSASNKRVKVLTCLFMLFYCLTTWSQTTYCIFFV